jgi:hypothetical protein
MKRYRQEGRPHSVRSPTRSARTSIASLAVVLTRSPGRVVSALDDVTGGAFVPRKCRTCCILGREHGNWWRTWIFSVSRSLWWGGSMSARLASGRGTFGASLAFGLWAAAELVFMLLPNARPLGRLLELIQFYLERLHPALGSIVGHSAMAQLVAACSLVWIASWTALGSFQPGYRWVVRLEQHRGGFVRQGCARCKADLLHRM